MCHQASALYQDLVRYLREQWALAATTDEADEGVYEKKLAQINALVKTWFFTPQDALHGDTPRNVIRREEKGLPNRLLDSSMDDDSSVDNELKQMIHELGLSEDDLHWYYDDGGLSLLDEFDPFPENDSFREFLGEETEEDDALTAEETGDRGEPGVEATDGDDEEAWFDPVDSDDVEWWLGEHGGLLSPAFWSRVRRNAWLDPVLHRAAAIWEERVGFYMPHLPGDKSWKIRWHRMTKAEALTVIAGLQDRGVDVGSLVEEIDAFEEERISIYWLVEPEQELSHLLDILLDDDDDVEVREGVEMISEFINAVRYLMPAHARMWLRGWIDAQLHGALAKQAGLK